MGSSDSKQEEKEQQNNNLNLVKNKEGGFSKKNSPNNSRKNSPNNSRRNSQQDAKLVQSRFHVKKDEKIQGRGNEGLLPNRQNNQDQNIDQFPQQANTQLYSYFQDWNPQFHQASKINLKVIVLNVEPTFQFKNLNRRFSEHFAELSWQYEYKTIEGQRKPFLRFIIEEDVGYYLSFVVGEDANVVEGDRSIWDLVCPFRTIEQTTKVGNYKCERFYQSDQPQIAEDEQQLNSQYFVKWEQKPPASRPAMRRLLQNIRQINQRQKEKGLDYRQTSKYFTNNNDWAFSVLVQQKFNCFKGWIIERDSSSDVKQRDKSAAMSATLKNDIQNRQTMYIEQMLKKRKSKNKRNIRQSF